MEINLVEGKSEMKKIILFGSKEHASMVIDNIEQQGMYKIFGIITNERDAIGTKLKGYELICHDDEVPLLIEENRDIEGYFLGIGNMRIREKLYKKLDRIIEPVNIIHPTSIISKHSKIGKGNIFEAYTKIANDVIVGEHCILNSFTSINHDQKVGNNVLIGCSVSLAGKTIGNNTIIADGASIAFKKSVGSQCIIGDGAVVTKDIPDNTIAYGNPAKEVKINDWPE